MKPVIIKAKGVYDTLKVRGCAGWGCKIILPDGTWMGSGGPIEKGVSGSTEAELTAIYNALSVAVARRIVRDLAVVEIHKNAREVVSVLLYSIPSAVLDGTDRIDPAVAVRRDLRNCEALQEIVAMANRMDLDITLRIEKCDESAKKAARLGMEQLRSRFA